MESGQALRAHIQALEERLLRSDVRRSRQMLDELLAEEFVEFASDGAAYDKAQVIAALQSEQFFQRSLTEFQIVVLADDVLLSTYRSAKIGGSAHAVVESLRSSVWKRRDGRWQMIFHQGTIRGAP